MSDREIEKACADVIQLYPRVCDGWPTVHMYDHETHHDRVQRVIDLSPKLSCWQLSHATVFVAMSDLVASRRRQHRSRYASSFDKSL